MKLHQLAFIIFAAVLITQSGCTSSETEDYEAKQIVVEQESSTPPPMNPPMNEGQSNR